MDHAARNQQYASNVASTRTTAGRSSPPGQRGAARLAVSRFSEALSGGDVAGRQLAQREKGEIVQRSRDHGQRAGEHR
jgi:hypothetical protein